MRLFQLFRSPDSAAGATGTPGAETKTETKVEPKADPPKVEPVNPFAADLAELNELRKERAHRKAEQEKAEREAALKRGEHERLLAEREAELAKLRGDLDSLSKAEQERIKGVAALNEERVKLLPPDLKALVPKGLHADALAEWLTVASAKSTPGVTVVPNKPDTATNTEVPQSVVDEAKYKQIDPAELWKIIQKQNPARAKKLIDAEKAAKGI